MVILTTAFYGSGQPTIQVVNSDGNDETRGLPELPLPDWLPTVVHDTSRDFAYTQVYRVLWDVNETVLAPIPTGVLLKYRRLFEVPNSSGQINDFAVTVSSATHQRLFSRFGNAARVFTLKKNHATLSAPATADLVISFIHDSQPLGRY